MNNLVFTQLSIPEIKQLFRQELENYFANQQPPKTEEADQLLTIDEAAEFIKLSKPTVYSLVSRKEIPHSKKGKRLYFSKQELKDWINSGRKKTNAEIAEEATNYTNRKKR